MPLNHVEEEADRALLELLRRLGEEGYDFTVVTPATHRRVIDRPRTGNARDLRDIFGWSLPFDRDCLAPDLFNLLERADALTFDRGCCRSKLRVARLGDKLFLHSGFPTDALDAVFFGPDSYRFVAFLNEELPRSGPVARVIDLGAGTGVGTISVAATWPDARLTAVDTNPRALWMAQINAKAAGVEIETVKGDGLSEFSGPIDLVIANPPFIMDKAGRAYRDGGEMYGARLSFDWSLDAARRLAAGGRMLLYTGSAIVAGHDALKERLSSALPTLGCSLRYRERDPDIFGEELDAAGYEDVERIAAIEAVVERPR